MDWNRAQTIFIIIFLILNLFLSAFLFIKQREGIVTNETIKETIAVLENRGIKIECDISKYTKDTHGLLLGPGNYDVLRINSFFGANAITFNERNDKVSLTGTKFIKKIDIMDKEKTTILLKNLFIDAGIINKKYKLSEYTDTDGSTFKIVFYEKYGGLYVFDNYLEILFDSEGIKRFTAMRKEIKKFEDKALSIIAAYQILLKNANEAGTVIMSLNLGYKGYFTNEEYTQVFETPAWRIKYKNGIERYFKATDGSEF